MASDNKKDSLLDKGCKQDGVVEERTLRNLKGADYNPRKINPQQMKMLKKALEEFGDLGGIVFNRRTGVLIGGHQRCKALPKHAPVEIVNRYDTPTRTGTVADGFIVIDGERFSYREVDWDIPREKAANVAANAHGGDWNMESLEELLRDVGSADIDLELTGFSLSDIMQTFGHDILGESPEQLMQLSERLRSTTEILEKAKDKTDDINHTDYYLVVVFRSYPERKAFTEKHGLKDNRYLDGDTLDTLISGSSTSSGA